jgi:hypothetical protein
MNINELFELLFHFPYHLQTYCILLALKLAVIYYLHRFDAFVSKLA